MVKAIHDEHYLLEQLGEAEVDYDEEEDEEEVKEFADDQEWEDYFNKERIEPTLKYIKDNPNERLLVSLFSS
jgi:hypothetical protein